MRPRAVWKGYLKLALIACPVALTKATSEPDRVSFARIHRKTLNKIENAYQDAVTGKPVETADIVKGIEIGPGKYVEVIEAEIEALAPKSATIIDIAEFVDPAQIPLVHYEDHYFLAPDGDAAAEAFALIRLAIAREGVAGLAQLATGTSERLIALTPCGNGLAVARLRYAAELRDPADALGRIAAPSPSLLELAEQAAELVAALRKPFTPERFRDRYTFALDGLVKDKIAGTMLKPVAGKPAAPPKPPRMTDLRVALARSLEATRERARKRA